MVSEAQRSRAPIQRLADRVSAVVCAGGDRVAVADLRGLGAGGPQPRLAYALVNAVAVLIIACPCALGSGDADGHHGGDRARRAGREC